VAFSGVVLGGAPDGHFLGEWTVVAKRAPSERG
jgi:hypothetical protein